MEKDINKIRAGKAGAAATHKHRYEMLIELSKLINKNDLNVIQSKWKTKQIELLLKHYKK